MNTNHIANSTLHIVASQTIDIKKDLEAVQTKSLSELLDEEIKKEENTKKD